MNKAERKVYREIVGALLCSDMYLERLSLEERLALVKRLKANHFA